MGFSGIYGGIEATNLPMSGPIRACSVCGESFWSMGPEALQGDICPVCAHMDELPAAVEDSRERPTRSVCLSALPLAKGMPARTDGPRPGLVVPRRLAGDFTGKAAVLPRVEPVPAEPAPSGLMTNSRQLGFNCPSCFTVLYIKEPHQYDGRAAPCPHCRVTILPPRIAPPSPFLLIAPPLPLPAALPKPGLRSGKWKPFKQHGLLPVEPELHEELDWA